jgi:hypothetical protein
MSDFRHGRDGAFWRRVDGLLAKNRARGNGMGVDGGGNNDGGLPIGNYV